MHCGQLARRIESLLPGASPAEVAGWCCVVLNAAAGVTPDPLDSEAGFARIWNEATLRLNAAVDQVDATQQELANLARSDPKKFSPDQVWILVRALKVQSQLLNLYRHEPRQSLQGA